MKQKLLSSFRLRVVMLVAILCSAFTGKAFADSWSRVTSKNELLEGGTFILGYEATANSGVIVPMQNEGTATTSAAGYMYSGTTSGSSSNNTIDMSNVASTSLYEVSIIASNSVSDAICIKIGDNFLGNTNTKNNCKLFTSASKNTSFVPSFGDNDVVTLTIQDNQTYKNLQFNNSSNSYRFAVYGGTQKNLVIYKKVSGSTSTPSISASNVDVAYGATEGNINFTLSNEPNPVGTLSANVASGNTIENFTLGAITGNTVPFTCSANDATTARTATVTLTYTYGDNETVTKDVTITQAAAPVIYSTIPALFDAATSTSTPVTVSFDNWVVTGVNGSQLFVTDGTNGFIVYQSSHGFVVGNTLSGTASCNLILFNGSAQLTGLNSSTEGLTVGTNGNVTPVVSTINALGAVNTGSVVTLNGLTYNGTNLSDGTNTIKYYTSLYNGTTLENGKTYNITGVFALNNTEKRILPRSAADIEDYTDSRADIATINEVSPTSVGVGVDGSFTLDIDYASSDPTDYEVTLTSSDNNILMVENDGTYLAGDTEGSVTLTVTVEPVDDATYKTVTRDFTINVVDNREEAGLAWSDSEVNIELNADETDYSLPTLSNPNNLTVTYESTNENVAVEVDGEFIVETSAEGTTTIKAVFAGNSSYKPMTVSYTINVYDPNVKGTEENPYTVADLIAMNGTAATTENVYVTGWIVGYLASSTNLITDDASKYDVSNIALADIPEETTISNVVAAQFQNNTARAALNAKNNPWNVGVAKVLLYGKLGKAFGKVALTSVLVASKKVAEQVSISSVGMATYYTDCALDFTGLTDMWAYVATLNGGAITFTRVNKVPANTGILLYNPGKASASQVVPVATGDMDAVGDNKFVGTLTDITALTGDNYYILNDGDEGLGFYKANGKKVAAHRAYLDATGASSRSFIGFDNDGTTTGIEAVENTQSAFAEFYNLNGQRVVAPQKGLYIVNGKKVMFK